MWSSPVAHGLPVGPGGHIDPVDVVILVSLGTSLMVGLGLWAAMRVARRPAGFAAGAAFGFGALLFLFFDLVKEASSLGQGLVADPMLPLLIVIAFVAGFLLIPGGARLHPHGSTVTWAWIAGIAFHTLAEGWIIGTEATQANILGEPFGTASFLIHKVIEAWTIIFVGGRSIARRDALSATLLLGAVAFFGAAAGHRFGPSMSPTYLFAAGAGAVASAALYISNHSTRSLKTSAIALAGILAVFAAGILHEI